MKTKLTASASSLLAVLALLTCKHQASAQGTAFTYQGSLQNGGAPANGSYDFVFSLYNDLQSGSQLGESKTNSAVNVANGLFTATLDFSSAPWSGQALWLQILVRTNGSEAFNELAPRQPLTPTPYAIQSLNAAMATTALSANFVTATNISGTILNSALPLNPVFSGNVTASAFTGNGAGLNNLQALDAKRDFGAKGDGVTDDTTALINWLNAASSNANLYLPAGTYVFNSILTLLTGTHLTGAGASSVLQCRNSAIYNSLYSLHTTNLYIGHLAIDCTYGGWYGLNLKGVTNAVVDNLYMYNPGLNNGDDGYGIWIESDGTPGNPSTGVMVENCHLFGVSDTGIELFGAMGCTVENNHVELSADNPDVYGIYVWNGSQSCVVNGNTVVGLSTGIGIGVNALTPGYSLANLTSNIVVTANAVNRCGNGVELLGTDSSNYICQIDCSDNSINSSDDGVYIGWCKDVRVHNNGIRSFYPISGNVTPGFLGPSWCGMLRTAIDFNNIFIEPGGYVDLEGNYAGSFNNNTVTGSTVTWVATLVSGWQYCSMSQNSFHDLGNPGPTVPCLYLAANGTNQCWNNTFIGNMVIDDRTDPSDIFIELGDFGGSNTFIANIGFIQNDGGESNNIIVRPGMQAALPPLNIWTNVTPSVTSWTNTTFSSGHAIVGGGTVTAVRLNGTTVYSGNNLNYGDFPLAPNGWIQITYSGAPTMVWVYQ